MIDTEYRKLALRTESKPNAEIRERAQASLRQQHAVWGLVTEIIELRSHGDDVNFLEECGDIEWYLQLAYDAFGMKLSSDEELISDCTADAMCELVKQAGVLADLMKRFIFYQDSKSLWEFPKAIHAVDECLEAIYSHQAIDRYEVRKKNIAKLAKRYPEKFTTEAAVNRDLEAERKVLESDLGSSAEAINRQRARGASSSYDRKCKLCPSPIHKSNETGVCGSCYAKIKADHETTDDPPRDTD